MVKENIQLFVNAQQQGYTRCLAPSMDCEEEAIRAHSIQNSRVLDLVQTNGHVLMPRFRLINGEPVMKFVPVGRNDASTFTGLCSKHDTELFRAIDTDLLDLDCDEHLRQLAYRSVMRELHTEIENGERAWAMHEELCKGRADPKEVITNASLLFLDQNKKAQNVFQYRARYFDTAVNLKHLIVETEGQPPILAASALFSVAFSSDGSPIMITLNVVPLSEDKTAAVITYPLATEMIVKKALAGLFGANGQTIQYELAKLIIQRVENFALSPAHYGTWSNDKKERVLREFVDCLSEPKDIADHADLNIFL